MNSSAILNKFLISFLIIIFMIILLGLSLNCGLPSLSQYDDLNAPTNLEITAYDQGTSITIKFTCFNYEENFKGYNVYIADEEGDVTNLSSIANRHITEGTDGFLINDTEIESEYIIKDEDDTLPTIKNDTLLEYYNSTFSEDLETLYDKTDGCYDDEGTEIYNIGDINENGEVCHYELKPYEFEYDITYLPDDSALASLAEYQIIVTAYDNEYFVESKATNQVLTSEFN